MSKAKKGTTLNVAPGAKLTVNIGKGFISSGYLEELEAFLAPYNLKITTGRVTVAL